MFLLLQINEWATDIVLPICMIMIQIYFRTCIYNFICDFSSPNKCSLCVLSETEKIIGNNDD